MSAAILVSQTWQPTVLQLMPFSNNNASVVGSRSDSSGGKNRDFPTLAVTRSHDDWVAHLQASSKVQRATSERMPRSHHSQLSGKQNNAKRAQSEYKVRETHKTEAALEKTCTANDLNSKIIPVAHHARVSPKLLHSATVSLTEIHGLSKPLQNHQASQKTWDGHYYLPQNGFWRAMTLTPGELDLQKHREVMSRDHAKRTKKLKMNINQLPRSNTPINDNDPDKLNMQHVIQFLKNHNDGNDDAVNVRPVLDRNRIDKDKEYFLRKRSCASASIEIATRQARNGVQTRSTDLAMPRYLRDGTMASTRSSPLLRDRVNRQMNGYNEWKPVSVGETSNMSGGCNKPFRLHRFIKMAPTCESNNTLSKSYTQVPFSHTLKTLEISDQIDLPKTKHDLHRFDPPATHHKSIPTVDRPCKLGYRLPAKRPPVKPASRNEMGRATVGCAMSANCNQSVGSDGTVIRLPSMHDFKTESDNESEGEDGKQTRAETKPEVVRRDSDQRTAVPTVHHNKVAFVEPYKRTFSTPGFRFPAEVKPSLKKLHVSVPRESRTADLNATKQSVECVKISLRQERGLTRESTYMSDLDRSKYGFADNDSESRESSIRITSSMSVENKTEKDDDDISSRTS